MNITDFIEIIPRGHENAISRIRLEELTGYSDRINRDMIMKARNSGVIILNLEDGKGYFRPKLPEELSLCVKCLQKEQGRLYAAQVACENLEAAIEFYS